MLLMYSPNTGSPNSDVDVRSGLLNSQISKHSDLSESAEDTTVSNSEIAACGNREVKRITRIYPLIFTILGTNLAQLAQIWHSKHLVLG